ncbi:MAG: discoidin domain-containing protein [Verrucomicrobia bacterium]|nr:discoidin domain-containing protein [Verrucomicrobiota bacterium]
MKTPTHRQSRATVIATLAFATLAFTTAPAATRESWQQRIEADWLLAEEVALLGGVSEPVTTQADAAGGCDGIKNGEWGFHTDNSKNPWWQVDLGTVQRLARVVVWNRTATAARAARIKVLLSDDGKEFRQVYQHDGTVFLGFKDNKPLVVALQNESARFVRVALPGISYLDLDEVEVFGEANPKKNLALNRPADQISVSQWSVSHEKTKLVDWARRAEETLVVCERLVDELNGALSLTQASGFSLTRPAATLSRSERARGISRWERENRSQDLENSEVGGSSRDLRQNRTDRKLFPLPQGEGQGEGERNAFATIASLKHELTNLHPNQSAQPLFLEARRLQRQLALANPLLRDFDTLLFTKRVPGSFNHMSDQYYGWWSKPGGGIYLLRGFTSDSPTEQCITTSFKEPGSFLRPTLSYDGTKVLFAWCRHYEHLAAEPNKLDKANVPEDAFYHLFEMNLDGSGLRQLTRGKYDDFDGRYLPDGRIVFLSTRRGQALQVGRESAARTVARADEPDSYVRCGGGPERPVAVYTLHTMNADGSDLVTISPFEMFEWTPDIAQDGRILYSRWDYIDRDNMPYMGLWAINPDGTDARMVFKNYTTAPHCTFEAKPIPGSHKIVFTGSAHHAQTMGSLVLLDPSAGLEGSEPMTRLTPEVAFPEIEGWPKTSYANPWPLSERFHLVAWGAEGYLVQGRDGWDRWHAVQRPRNGMALYLYDAATRTREALWIDEEISCGDPIPVRPRERPPIIASQLADSAAKEGRFLVTDVYRGLTDVQRGEIQSLRIVAVPAKTHPTMNFPNLGVTRDDPGKCVLGTVPVENDGSAYFRVPAGVIVFFQALNAQGVAVQTMRGASHVQAGQTLSCIGCHEPRQQAPPAKVALASLREPSRLTAGPAGSWPLRFDHLVQPVLDRQCVSCHNPSATNAVAAKFDLSPAKAYETLVAYGKPSLNDQVWAAYRRGYSIPGDGIAQRSALLALLDAPEGHHDVNLNAAARERLLTWLDTYAQRLGHFSDEQERELIELRRASAGLLIERPSKETAAMERK